MRERARAEAHRLKGGRFTLDHSLTLALFRSANGDPAEAGKAKAMLDAQERAAMERDRQAALARIARIARVATGQPVGGGASTRLATPKTKAGGLSAP